ncbi:hypothetical protein EON09_13815 [Pseudomonas soli]|nr:hypothetical protein [Pseudomonas soli]
MSSAKRMPLPCRPWSRPRAGVSAGGARYTAAPFLCRPDQPAPCQAFLTYRCALSECLFECSRL